jgi:hypothetical protein
MDDCSSSRIEAVWPDGTQVAVLEEEHCQDQKWVISGENDARLVDDE